jgi:rhodanese-related sulfurtransferase
MPSPASSPPSAAAAPGGRTRRRAIAALAVAGAALAVVPALREQWAERATADLRVSLDEARAEVEAGRALLIDIREPAEHATGVAPGARLLPMRQLATRLDDVAADRRQPVLLICQTQSRSRATVQSLRERGYANVRYVRGGMREWMHRGWPLVRPGG